MKPVSGEASLLDPSHALGATTRKVSQEGVNISAENADVCVYA
jgi:hypothetical protein